MTGVLAGLHTLCLHNLAAALRAMAQRCRRAPPPAAGPGLLPAAAGGGVRGAGEGGGGAGVAGEDLVVAELSAKKLIKRRLQVTEPRGGGD